MYKHKHGHAVTWCICPGTKLARKSNRDRDNYLWQQLYRNTLATQCLRQRHMHVFVLNMLDSRFAYGNQCKHIGWELDSTGLLKIPACFPLCDSRLDNQSEMLVFPHILGGIYDRAYCFHQCHSMFCVNMQTMPTSQPATNLKLAPVGTKIVQSSGLPCLSSMKCILVHQCFATFVMNAMPNHW